MKNVTTDPVTGSTRYRLYGKEPEIEPKRENASRLSNHSLGPERSFEIDRQSSLLTKALGECTDVLSVLPDRLAPFLREPSDNGEGHCEEKLSCPFAVEIQCWRQKVEFVTSAVRDILDRLESDRGDDSKKQQSNN